MKNFKMLTVVAMMMFGWAASYGQGTEAEVPGDHFSLEGALELFKQSSSPEEFEKLLNSPDTKVNNLDLNGDGYIDYIRVVDRFKGNIHTFTLQAVISTDQVQDIAVIELEKLASGKAVLQIIGDEDIYGVTTIIEPTREVRTYAGTQTSRTVVNVWAWPSVQYVYSVHYNPWVSPWGWYNYPVWWTHWRPVAYVHYYPIWRPYYQHYVVCHTRRVVHAYDIYRPYRTTSVIVHKRYSPVVVRYREAHRDGYRRNDGRTFVRDDRSRTRSNSGRIDNVQRRSSDVRNRAEVRDVSPSQNRTATTPQRATTPARTREMSERPERVQQPVRSSNREVQVGGRDNVSSGARTRAETKTAPSPVIRTETPRRSEVQRSSAPTRTREVPAPTNTQQRPATVERAPRQQAAPSPTPSRQPTNTPTRSANPTRSRSVQ